MKSQRKPSLVQEHQVFGIYLPYRFLESGTFVRVSFRGDTTLFL
jgi:hypothetical protein